MRQSKVSPPGSFPLNLSFQTSPFVFVCCRVSRINPFLPPPLSFYIRSLSNLQTPIIFWERTLASALMPIPLHLFAKSFRFYGATLKSENQSPGKYPRPNKAAKKIVAKVQLLNAVSRSMASEPGGDGRSRC